MDTTKQLPTHDEIAQRAYSLWEQRGHPEGHDIDFWLEAERQIASGAKTWAKDGQITKSSLELELHPPTSLVSTQQLAPKRSISPAKSADRSKGSVRIRKQNYASAV